MKTDVFFTGTTFECALQIVKDGYISTQPPHRVWEEHSGEYVYFIDPLMVKEDLEYEEGFLERAIILSADQASFAVWKFDHTRRVIFEVELDRSKCERDHDAGCSVRYPQNVDCSMIKGVYLEKRNNCRKLKESVAIKKFLENYETDDLLDTPLFHEMTLVIKGLHYVKPQYRSDVEKRYDELVDWQGDLSLFSYMPLSEFMKRIAPVKQT